MKHQPLDKPHGQFQAWLTQLRAAGRAPVPAHLLRSARGMTLIEIIIVIGLIASVSGFLLSKIFENQDKARARQAKAQINSLAGQMELYNGDCGSYPTTEQGLAALISPPAGDSACSNWGPNPYLKEKDLKDPWNNEFVYESDGTGYVIKSLGKDKREGGDGAAKDISSEE